MDAITKTQISQYAKPKRINLKTQRDEDGTPWMVLSGNISYGHNLWPEAFIQNSTTKQADMTYHLLSPRTGTCHIIFMAAAADTKRNFNACP